MRYFSQLLTVGAILWISSIIFPNYVYIEDTKTLVVVAIVYSLVSMIFAILILCSLLTFLLSGQIIPVIIIVCFLTIITSYFSLITTETIVSGFQINGFYPRLAIAFLTALFSTNATSDTASRR